MFYLKCAKNSKIGNIYLHYRKKNLNVKYYIGESVEVDGWDNVLHRVKQENGYHWKKINKKIDQVEEYLLSLVTAGGDSESIKNDLAMKFGGKYVDRSDFHAYAEMAVLKDFRPVLKFGDINYNFMRELASWMEKSESKKTGKRYKTNYIAAILEKVRMKYNKAVREGLAPKVDLDFKYKAYRNDVTAVYLSETELEVLRTAKMIKPRAVVRDWFLIGCYTGLRVGNYLTLKDCKINRDENYMEVVVNKNGPTVKIPLHRTVLEILDRWGDNIPVPPKVNGFNRTIKTVCKYAKINEKVFVVEYIGGRRVVTQVEKWEMISSHTARRSLATNLYLRNVPLRYIMGITGHKTDAMCLRYIKAGLNDMYEEVAKLDFWK